MSQFTQPRPDELELSLFGPGIGECAVVHLGAGNWMTVDSCLNAADKAIAIDYLERIGVTVSSQVKLVAVTHWHDDHIRGAGQLLRHATNARFVCSAAMLSEEFITLVTAGEETKLVAGSSGLAEFADILETIQSRVAGKAAAGPAHWACEGMCLFRDNTVEVHSVSPSAQTITDAKGQIAALIPMLNDSMRAFPNVAPNDLSVVMLVVSPGVHLLLGADLEQGRNDQCGWRGVVASTVRPAVMSSVYKVAHHGSEGADIPSIWTRLLVPKPHAMVTPYARGTKPLPSPADIKRLQNVADRLYITVSPTTTKPPRRKNADRTINEIALRRGAVRKTPGHIRLRVPLAGSATNIKIELFDGATQLK